MTTRITSLLIVMIGLSVAGIAQPARVLNASFEGEPRDATIPRGWYDCEPGTTPDILPGPWGVYLEASAGETYVGLITRENGSWESIGQKLTKKLEEGICYYFSLELARSDEYMGYNKPLKLRVWGGNAKCNRTQLLVETDRISHTDWQTYSFDFTAETDLRYIIVEAYHADGNFAYAGNILIDNISPIRQCGRTMLLPND